MHMFYLANNKGVWEVDSKKCHPCVLGIWHSSKRYSCYVPQTHQPNMSQHIAFLEMVHSFVTVVQSVSTLNSRQVIKILI